MSANTETPPKEEFSTWTTSPLMKWLMPVLAFILMAILLIGLYLSNTNDGLGSSAAAGWMQAIGTVFAVAMAFLIAKNQSEVALKTITNAQKIAEESKKNGTLAVVRAANSRATSIGDAISSESPIKIYEVYNKTIITGIVETLSAAPLYELGSPKAITALLSLRDQFVFLENEVEEHLAGPWKHRHVGPVLEGLPSPEYSTQLDDTLKSTKKNLARNVTTRVEYIQKQCSIIEHALTS